MPNSTNKSNANPFLARQQMLFLALQQARLDALALNPGPSLTYLTGLHFHLSERPVVALFTANQPIRLVLPELEQAKLLDLPYPVHGYPYGEDPDKWAASFQAAIHAGGLESSRVGVEPHRLRLLEFRLLLQAAPEAD